MKLTKNILTKSLILTALLGVCLCSRGQVLVGLNAWSAGATTTNYGGYYTTPALTNFVVGSIFANNGKQPLVTFLSVKSDITAGTLTFWGDVNFGITNVAMPAGYRNGNATNIISFGPVYDSTGTNVIASNTNGLIANMPIIIRHLANENYEVRLLSSYTTTNVTLNAATSSTVQQGDMLYPMVPTGSLSCGATTLTLGPGGIVWAGQPGVPPMVSVNSSNAFVGPFISGIYQ